ncbi:MAG TPA: hypothetical protein VMY87_02025, partial [Armatimonadota bacterium]|nr:hypothetical protein [Armatimonadota bacterium]
LGLPFTRRQVWLGKTLAGLALLLSAVVLVIIPGAIAARPALEEVMFWQLLPDLAVATLLLFCGALLFSSLSLSISNAFIGALGLSAALVISLIAFTFLAGARLTPYGPLIDIDLWALASCPALLAGSYVGFTRGELLRGRRRWLLPIATALLVMLIISIPIIAAARWTTRYDRDQVETVWKPLITGGGRVATLYTQASQVRPLRSFEERWIGDSTEYRRAYSVTLDLDTGKELLVLRETDPPVVSPDGALAAVLPDIRPLTWRGGDDLDIPKRSVEVWDLKAKRVTYRGLPKAFLRDRPPNIQYAAWSPDGRWLTLLSQDSHGWQPQGDHWRLLIMKPDGSQPQTVELHGGRYGRYDQPTYAWAPDGSAVYSFSAKGDVVRFTLPDGETKTIWSWRDELTPPMFAGRIAASPDGNSLAVSLIDYSPLQVNAQPHKFFAFVLSADGKQSDMIWSDVSEPTSSLNPGSIVWTEDSSGVRVGRVTLENGSRQNQGETITWRRGEAATIESKPPPGDGPTAPSDRDLQQLDPTGALTPVTTAALREALSWASVIGNDHRGRIILRNWDFPPAIFAFDPATGERTHIYP